MYNGGESGILKMWSTSTTVTGGDNRKDKSLDMKTISIDEFKNLIANGDWQRNQDYEIVERLERHDENWDNESEKRNLIVIPCAHGWASKTSTLDQVQITYTEQFSYDEYEPDSLTSGIEQLDEAWSLKGVIVTDEDGEALTNGELSVYLNSEFSSIDYDSFITRQIYDVDYSEDSDMKTYILKIDNAPDIRFKGEILASVASSDNQAVGSGYSGQIGRWTELILYKTEGGKFICHQIGRTRWEGERDRFSGKVCTTLDEVKEFFGHRWLAKELYDNAGIEDSITID